MEDLKKFISAYTPVDEEDWGIIAASFEERTFSKGEAILSEGDVCKYFYFLRQGIVRFFIVNSEGNDITKFFTVAPYFFTSKISFNKCIPAAESIEAIEKCRVLQITLENSNKLMSVRTWNDFTRKLLHEIQDFTEKALVEARTKTAEEIYKKLIAQNPGLVNRIPVKYLATYLGIAPQSLSRIRRKIASDLKK